MFPFGFLMVALGALVLDSVLKNQNPIETIKAIVTDPKNARQTIATHGTAYSVSPYTPGSGSTAPSPSGAATGAVTASYSGLDPRIAGVIAFARAQIGKPYVWGGTGPNGWDCSGLTQGAYASQGIHISRVVSTQAFDGTAVPSRDALLPGDLVMPTGLSHIQIYSGNGMVIEAADKKLGIREVPMYGFWRARRIINGSSSNPVRTV